MGGNRLNILGHLETVTRHRTLVMKHCFLAGIPFRGLVHDLSKFSPTEFIPGARYYEEGKRSPNEREREVTGYSAAWMHHKGRNPHHWEYWFDVSPVTHRYEPVRMPIDYLKESFCDRVAASKIYRGADYTDASALEYFCSKKQMESLMHPCTACILGRWLEMLARDGEEKTFARIRRTREIVCHPETCEKVRERFGK
ncbi:MAG: catalase [Clostridia bacterium]|nr:catalase [Clostridia bacterium]